MKWLPLTLMLFMLPACARAECPEGTLAWTETQMFFGRGMQGGGEVTDAAWGAFVRDHIVPSFPDGFTVVDSAGFWKGCPSLPSGVCERSKVLLVQYGTSDEADSKLASIADAYIKTFSQQAVMRSDSPVCTRFYSSGE